MEKTSFIKNGEVMLQDDYESLGDMISQCDCILVEDLLTTEELLHKHRDHLSDIQIELLTKRVVKK